jgi:autotransporter-associated beta strand protein
VGNEVQVGRDNGTGTLNLNGGTVNANKISGGTGSATVNFNGGVLKAKKDESNLIENLDVADVQSGGLKIDSNGFNVSTSQVLTGTGGLEKSGAGQLTLSGANTYAGTTTVAAGVLRIEKTGLNAIVDATADTLVAEFTSPPAAGDYQFLPGPLAGSQTFSATNLGANQQATFNNQTSTVTVTNTVTDPFVTWIDGFTPNALLPDEASKLPSADPDGDGTSEPIPDASWAKPGFEQDDQSPVTCVTWDDAQAYVTWLSRSTGETYRLLSESEWEYAARAGTATPFSFGSTISPSQANYGGNFTYANGSTGEYRERTTAVGSFASNAFGLFDMHGNVWEWVEDCFAENYAAGQPSDGSAFRSDSCSNRVNRGGSWYGYPQFLRSANRDGDAPSNRLNFLGFRVARTLSSTP